MPAPSYLGACRTMTPGTPETLRKAFMSWTLRQKLPRDIVERWAGHSISGMAVITERYYYADLELAELLPVSEGIEAALASTYKSSLHLHKSMS